MEDKILQLLIQGGAVGLCAYTLYVLNKLVGNHISHATDTMSRLEIAITKLTQFLEDKIK